MAEEKIYPYAVARIRVLEKKLLNLQSLTQMAEAKTPEDVLRMLTEAGFGQQSIENVHNFETLLSQEMVKSYEIIKELIPEEGFVDVFMVKNDYHNIKVLIKEEISGVDGSKYLVEGGTVELESLKKMFTNHNFSDLPVIMANSIKDAYEAYSKTQNGQMIDIVLDKGTFINMMISAKESGNSFVIKYVERICDISNLKSFLRIKNMKKGFETFLGVFVKGGNISTDLFAQAFNSESFSTCFKATSYSEICELGMNAGFTVFEKMCDNFIMDFVKDAKFKALTVEPLVAYLYAKEMEIKTVRIIMTSKLNNIDTDIIKERVRDAYV